MSDLNDLLSYVHFFLNKKSVNPIEYKLHQFINIFIHLGNQSCQTVCGIYEMLTISLKSDP